MFSNLTPTVRALLIINLGMYAAQVFLGPDQFAPLELWPLHSDPAEGGLPFQPWQVITYGFLHIEFWHLFANMFGLYMFGPDVERLLGIARFRWYYLTCVIGAAGAQLLVTSTIHPSPYPTLGASGGIFGLLLCYGMAYPHRRLMLVFPPIPMPAWLLVTLRRDRVVSGCVHQQPGRGAFCASGRHGRRLRSDQVLAMRRRRAATSNGLADFHARLRATVGAEQEYRRLRTPLAHSTMPADTPKRILRGSRFATAIDRPPTSCSGA